MKKITNKIAVYMIAGIGILSGDIWATEFASMDPSDNYKFPTPTPLTSGKLNTGPKNFYLACTGKCEKIENSKLEFNGYSQIPNFFKISMGRLMYGQPTAMCKISLPGARRTIAIRLNEIQVKNNSSEATNFKKHVCLGIMEGTTITSRIYTGQVAYVEVAGTDNADVEGTDDADVSATDSNVVKLVPLLTKTEISDVANTGKLLAKNDVESSTLIGSIISLPSTNFDFTTVFRLQAKGYEIVSDADFVSKIEWSPVQNHSVSLQKVSATDPNNTNEPKVNTWHNQGAGLGVGLVHGELRMLAIDNATGKLASSLDGKIWKSEGIIAESIAGISSGWQIAPVYGKSGWCVLNTNGTSIYCTDDKLNWIKSSESPKDTSTTEPHTLGLAFGGKGENKVFLTICKDGKVWTSRDGQNWIKTSGGNIPYASGSETRAFCYDQHNENWVAFTKEGHVYRSVDSTGNETWKLIDSQNLTGIAKQHWFCGFYARGHFWLYNSSGCVAVSPNGINWYKYNNDEFKEAYSMTFFNDELYVLKYPGYQYIIGTFNDPFKEKKI